MPMKFEGLNTEVGIKKLNGFLTSKSYIDGFQYSSADLETFKAIPSAPDASKFPHAYRWFVHIASIVGVRVAFSSSVAAVPSSPKKQAASPKKATSPKKAASPKKGSKPAKDDDDDDDDLFGDDDDEDDEEAKALAKKRAEQAKDKKKEKKKVIERSQCVFEVKPWEAETDLEELAAKIKAVKIEGLSWGEGHKLVPVAYGIKKLLIQCVIIDDMVLIEDITDAIEQFEDYVQSVDMASMNKL